MRSLLNEIHDYFEPTINEDAEMLYAFGLAADMFWYMFENEKVWEKRALDYKWRYSKLAPDGINPEVFRGRGVYGEYYAGHAELEGGY